MNRFCALVLATLLMTASSGCLTEGTRPTAGSEPLYVFNRAPLVEEPYAVLPIGAVRPQGWIRDELERMATGMTGHLDEWYPTVGTSNAWVGGDGDGWERGPYWLDGLVPLAYLLQDSTLIAKAQRYIEWTLASARDDGYFGPEPEADSVQNRPQQQRRNRADWWPRMVMLKVLQSYYDATGDERVPALMTGYFRYQAAHLDAQPLDHWTGWGKARGGENQASIYWLYNRTGDPELLALAQRIFDQTVDWTGDFLAGKTAEDYWRTHVVNVAMGVKQPGLQYLLTGDRRYLEAVHEGIRALMDRHGQVIGMFSGDELLHGTDPTHGTELCAVVEFMYSLETLLLETGDTSFADRLERVAFNALPTQVTDDYTGRQYFQQANQIRIAVGDPKIFFDAYTDALCFGLLTGYPCCTTNLHQGWPKFARRLWLASRDRGLAALVYGPSTVSARVGDDGAEVTLVEETEYPFGEEIRITVDAAAPVAFPLDLRVPAWADGATLSVNDEEQPTPPAGGIARIDRTWRAGDVVRLRLPMAVRTSRWQERSVAVERGPLVFALAVDANARRAPAVHAAATGDQLLEYEPRTAWNYGLLLDQDHPEASFEVVRRDASDRPWSRETVPVQIRAHGVPVSSWKEYNGTAGPLPASPVYDRDTPAETLTLIPYGASTLRVAEFPEVRR